MSEPMQKRLARAVGAELRRLRRAAGLTQEDVALALDSYRPIVCRTERGLHVTSLEVCVAQATACGGSVLDVTRAIDRELGLRMKVWDRYGR